MVRTDQTGPDFRNFAQRAMQIVHDLVDDVELDVARSGRCTITGLLGDGERVGLASECCFDAALAHMEARKLSGALAEHVEWRKSVIATKNDLLSMID